MDNGSSLCNNPGHRLDRYTQEYQDLWHICTFCEKYIIIEIIFLLRCDQHVFCGTISLNVCWSGLMLPCLDIRRSYRFNIFLVFLDC